MSDVLRCVPMEVGVTCMGRAVDGAWPAMENQHNNYLEHPAVSRALQHLRPLIQGMDMLVRSDYRTMVASIKMQSQVPSLAEALNAHVAVGCRAFVIIEDVLSLREWKLIYLTDPWGVRICTWPMAKRAAFAVLVLHFLSLCRRVWSCRWFY